VGAAVGVESGGEFAVGVEVGAGVEVGVEVEVGRGRGRRGAVSDLPSDALTYETVVAEYFLGLRGAGLMLSPLDVELVRAWKLRGIPVPVVCRGLRFGYERALAAAPSGAPPRSVRALRLAVEDEWRAYRASRVAHGDPGDPPHADVAARAGAALALLDAAARRATSPAIAAAHAAAAAALAAAAEGRGAEAGALDAALQAADVAALRAWARDLAPAAREAVGRFCALRAGPRARTCTRAAHRAALLAHARDYARGAGLTLVSGTV
jgi:hypothetical protein